MQTTYNDWIYQNYDFPQLPFSVNNNQLSFKGINLVELHQKYGSPLRVSYLPLIQERVQQARNGFKKAFEALHYNADYHYGYCTKSSHFSFVLDAILEENCFIETSSTFDIEIVNRLYDAHKIDANHLIICNGYKTEAYLTAIAQLANKGFKNITLIVDDYHELEFIEPLIINPLKIGIRIATDEDPKFEFYTSRLGVRIDNIQQFYLDNIHSSKKFELQLLHFFINAGIKDTLHYWNELNKCLECFLKLHQLQPSLRGLNLGGGFPVKNSLLDDFPYEYMIHEIVKTIQESCDSKNVPYPNLYTEFGSYTVAESGFILYQVLAQKKQNDKERWNIINSSFITTLPDTWSINKRYIMLAINNWDQEYERVFLGGITCDGDDYYNSEQHTNAIYLPKYDDSKPLLIGFFNMGAYQESISGYGGIKHCLIPSPKHIIIDKNHNIRVFAEEQNADHMLTILGY